jgi:hypothetical protein
VTTGRNKVMEAAAAWRDIPERDRIETCMDVSCGTRPTSPSSLALLALADAAARMESEPMKVPSTEKIPVFHPNHKGGAEPVGYVTITRRYDDSAPPAPSPEGDGCLNCVGWNPSVDGPVCECPCHTRLGVR